METIYFQMLLNKKYYNNTMQMVLDRLHLGKNKQNKLFANNNITINSQIATKDTIIVDNSVLSINITPFEQLNYLPWDCELEVIYEDDYLIAFNKPSGIIIYSDQSNQTMANAVANYYQMQKMNRTVRHLHRLDTDTTGCLLYAKDMITHAAMDYLFAHKEITKTYLAIVDGHPKSGVITTPIGTHRHQNGKMTIKKAGENLLTKYKILKKNPQKSLLEVNIATGKTHQIRVHLASIGYPIVGDKTYGSISNIGRVLLHAWKLTFKHPITNKEINIQANIPTDIKKIIKTMN